MKQGMRKAEELLFQKFSRKVSFSELPLVFVIASPRAGSTVVYQLMINLFNFFYFSNLVNDHFAEFPVVGAALDSLINPRRPVSYKSAYGKTRGIRGPSEGSLIFKNWFGGQHPSQTKSCKVLPGKTEHFVSTMKSIYGITGFPIISKNAWNCFRIQELTGLFPNIHFLWIRRDITTSALSDLEARYRRGGPIIWNSATTTNYREIQKRPYWEQVVEQQYEYNKSIAKDLGNFSQERYIELWYEDICDHPETELDRLNRYFSHNSLPRSLRGRRIPALSRSSGPTGLEEDYLKIVGYVEGNRERFSEYTYERACRKN